MKKFHKKYEYLHFSFVVINYSNPCSSGWLVVVSIGINCELSLSDFQKKENHLLFNFSFCNCKENNHMGLGTYSNLGVYVYAHLTHGAMILSFTTIGWNLGAWFSSWTSPAYLIDNTASNFVLDVKFSWLETFLFC